MGDSWDNAQVRAAGSLDQKECQHGEKSDSVHIFKKFLLELIYNCC